MRFREQPRAARGNADLFDGKLLADLCGYMASLKSWPQIQL